MRITTKQMKVAEGIRLGWSLERIAKGMQLAYLTAYKHRQSMFETLSCFGDKQLIHILDEFDKFPLYVFNWQIEKDTDNTQYLNAKLKGVCKQGDKILAIRVDGYISYHELGGRYICGIPITQLRKMSPNITVAKRLFDLKRVEF